MKDLMISLLFLALFLTQIFLGSLLILSFQKMVEARWIASIESYLLSNLRLFVILPVLFILLFLGRAEIYPWTHSESLRPGFPRFYFDPWFFALRNIFFFVIWGLMARRLRQKRMKTAAAPLILILVTGSIFTVDWLLSLQPEWKSSAFPIIFLIGSLLLTHGLTLSSLRRNAKEWPLQDLNSLHFALIAVWAYLCFSQFIIIWSSNLPDEVTWYLPRIHSSWQRLPQLLIAFQFIATLLVLLFRKIKRSFCCTRLFGFTTFLWQMIFIFWNISPSVHPQGFTMSITDIAVVILLLAAWFFQQRRVLP